MNKIYFLIIIFSVIGCSKSSEPISQTDDIMDESAVASFTDVYPTQAFENDILTITGENIDITATYSVSIGQFEAPVVEISQTELRVQIPEGTEGGSLKIVGPETDTTLNTIDVLLEDGTFYAVVEEGNSNSIVRLNVSTGEILESIYTIPLSEFKITDMEYASSINSLILIGDSTNDTFGYGRLNLGNNQLNLYDTRPYDLNRDLTVGSNGRVFVMSNLSFAIIEIDIMDGSIVGDLLYDANFAYSNGIVKLHYLESTNKLIFYERIIDFNYNESTVEKNIDLTNNTLSGGQPNLLEDVNKDGTNMMFSAYGRNIGLRSPGQPLIDPVETSFWGIFRMNYSSSSERLLFKAEEFESNVGAEFFVRYHLPTGNINSVQLNKEFKLLTIVE